MGWSSLTVKWLTSLKTDEDILTLKPRIIEIVPWKKFFLGALIGHDVKSFVRCLLWIFSGKVLGLMNQYLIFGALLSFLNDSTRVQWTGWMFASIFFAIGIVENILDRFGAEASLLRQINLKRSFELQLAKILVRATLDAKIVISQVFNAFIPQSLHVTEFFLDAIVALLLSLGITIIIFFLLGWIIFVVIGLIIAMNVAGFLLGMAEGDIQDKLYSSSRKRIAIVEETVNCIFHVKIQGLEQKCLRDVVEAREVELRNYFTYFCIPGALFPFIASFGGNLVLYGVTFGTGDVVSLANLYLTFPLISMLYNQSSTLSNFLFFFGLIKSVTRSTEAIFKLPTVDVGKEYITGKSDAIFADNCSFGVGPDFVVTNVTFELKLGQWLTVYGPSGSGKTSLILGLLKERNLLSGRLNIDGKFVFCPQVPFMIDGTVRSNITFGLAYDEENFFRVARAVGLESDFKQWQGEDMFRISNSSGLSGGQRQRISLARAMYADGDVFLLDDSLSALDVKVKTLVFDSLKNVWSKKGVLLATIEAGFLVDGHAMLEKGIFKLELGCKSTQNECPSLKELAFGQNLLATSTCTGIGEDPPVKYLFAYVKACVTVLLLFVVVQFLFEGIQVFAFFWVSLWTAGELKISALQWILGYLGIFLGGILFFFLTLLTTAGFGIQAAKIIHERAFSSLVGTSIRFFDEKSPKTICSRFSNDVRMLDDTFPIGFAIFIASLISMISILVVMCYIFPLSLIGAPVLVGLILIIFFRISHINSFSQRLSTNVSTESLSMLNTCFSGRVVFRSFQRDSQIIADFINQLQLSVSATYAARMVKVWFSMRLQFFVRCYFLATSILSIFLRGNLGGLFLTFGLQLGSLAIGTVSSGLMLKKYLVNLVRVMEFGDLEPESRSDVLPPSNWPASGKVEIFNLSLRYSPNLPFVLKHISLLISPNSSTGIVGRTGAGKSSIFLALFGLYKIEGQIKVDGLDLLSFNLNAMRFQLSIIPQEAIFFNGSLRKNLDPEGTVNSDELLALLENFQLSKQNMDSEMQELIGNRGLAQKYSFVRALAKQGRLLFIDEGTSSLESDARKIVSQVLEQTAKTKILVAHQLETVMKCDQIIVLDSGRVVEFDQPALLIQKQGFFQSLVKAGAESDLLELIGEEKGSNHCCFICRNDFSNQRRITDCKTCVQKVCQYCSYVGKCMYCFNPADREYYFALSAAVRPSEKLLLPCSNCKKIFSTICCRCDNLFCDECSIYFRDIWDTKSSASCKSCWPALGDFFLSKDETEGRAEIIQGDSFSLPPSEYVMGTCTVCRKKGVNLKCSGCLSFICSVCSGYVCVPLKSNRHMQLLCLICLKVEKFSRQLFGDPPGFLSLTLDQEHQINSKVQCNSCSEVMDFFLQPYNCERCNKFSCRKCFAGMVCAKCSSGKNFDNPDERLVCDECGVFVLEKDAVWMNENRFHPKCVALYRKQNTKICAECGQMALFSQRTCLFNGCLLHDSCLVSFKKRQTSVSFPVNALVHL